MRVLTYRVAAWLACASTVACHRESDEARRSEVARVAEAARKLREAPNPAKDPLLKALKSTACTADDACGLKETCSAAYSLQARAMDGLAAVRRAATHTTEPVPSGAAALLSEVETDLQRAKVEAQHCSDREGELRRKYRL